MENKIVMYHVLLQEWRKDCSVACVAASMEDKIVVYHVMLLVWRTRL